MIARITGQLEALDQGKALIALAGGLSYEVLLPGFVQSRLGGQIGQPVTLFTIHFLEGSAQGTSFVPRLAGFMTETERRFYELFTQVKGIGPRKALRAMTLQTGQIAGAIADRDAKLLQSLPEIGKRMAETIIATLHGKVDAFLEAEPAVAIAAGDTETEPADTARSARRAAAREALDIFTQLGENRVDALRWIDQVMASDPELADTQDLVSAVYRLRGEGG